MARYPFGGQYQDFVVAPVDGSAAGISSTTLFAGVATTSVTVWTAAVGGTRITDLQDAAGNPIQSITTAASFVPLFFGPDGVTQLWLDAGGGTRGLTRANNATDLYAGLQAQVAQLQLTVASLSTNAIIPPSAPAITAVQAFSGYAVVTVTAPASNGGAPVTQYVVTSSPDGLTGTGTAAGPVTVSGLSNGTAYTFTAVAVNAAGAGSASSGSAQVTPTAPAVPAVTITGSSRTTTTATVTWSLANPTGVTGFLLTGGGTSTTVAASATSYTFPNLTAGTPYTFTVAPVPAGVGTSASVPVTTTAITAPSAPGLTANVGTAGQATLAWTVPSSNGGAGITNYTLYVDGAQVTSSGTAGFYVDTLTAGSHTAYVTATNSAGLTGTSGTVTFAVASAAAPGAPTNVAATATGSATASVSFTPADANATSFTATAYPVPAAATGLTTSGASPTSAVLSWTAPAGATITGWQVWWQSSGGTAYTAPVLPASATSYQFTALNAGTAYTLTVKAVNGPAVGAGASTTVTTPANSANTTLFGTLMTTTNSSQLTSETAGGLQLAMLEPFWRRWETAAGVFSSSYDASFLAQVQAYQAAGMAITLSLGLHFNPNSTVTEAGSGNWMDPTLSHFVDQNGVASGSVDFTWSAYSRTRAQLYIQHIASIVPLSTFDSIRITGGCASELLYPQNQAGTAATYMFWGNSAWALNGGSNLAPGAVASPFPAYVMGNSDTTSLTFAQRTAVGNWYIDSLGATAKWIEDTCIASGFNGWFEIVTPGLGVTPAGFASAISAGFPAGSSVGSGDVKQRHIAGLSYKAQTYLHCSSVGDGSGSDSVPVASDLTVDPSSTALPSGLSSLRWAFILASTYLGGRLSGENPGYPTSATGQAHYNDTSSAGLLAVVFRMMAAADNLLTAQLRLYWAHDYVLFTAGDLALSSYTAAISSSRGGAAPPPLPSRPTKFPPVAGRTVVTSSTGTTNANSVPSWTHTIGAGLNNALVVMVAETGGNAQNITSEAVTLDGAAMTKVGTADYTTTPQRRVTLWAAVGVSAGAHTLTAGGLNNTQTAGIGAISATLYNVAQSLAGAFGTPNSVAAGNLGTGPANTLSGTVVTDLVLGAWAVRTPTTVTRLYSTAPVQTLAFVSTSTPLGILTVEPGVAGSTTTSFNGLIAQDSTAGIAIAAHAA